MRSKLKVLIPEKPDKIIIKAAEAKNTPIDATLTMALMALLWLLEKRYLLAMYII
jgi:hypothetical protein